MTFEAVAYSDEHARRELMPHLLSYMATEGYPCGVSSKPHTKRRTLSANALYWRWMETMAQFMSERTGRHFDKDTAHDLCRHLHLGYRTNPRATASGSVIPPQLRSTKKLTTSEFCFYMNKIDSWAAIHLGLKLPKPQEGDFYEYQTSQGAA